MSRKTILILVGSLVFIAVGSYVGLYAIGYYLGHQMQAMENTPRMPPDLSTIPKDKLERIVKDLSARYPYESERDENKEKIEKMRKEALEYINSLLFRTAELQARINRLDELGRRIAKKSKLDKEFNFGNPNTTQKTPAKPSTVLSKLNKSKSESLRNRDTPVFNVEAGVVTKIFRDKKLGYTVEIEHAYKNGKFTTRHAGLYKLQVKTSAKVIKLQTIGYIKWRSFRKRNHPSARQGQGKGGHIHYEVRKDGKVIEPSK